MPLDLGLEGTSVLVTGANGGIGCATVEAFLNEGARVAAHYRSSDAELRALKARHRNGKNLHCFQADLADELAVKRLFEEIQDAWGMIVVKLIVNHAIYIDQDVSLRDMTLTQWNTTLTSNLTSSFLVIRGFLSQVRTYGKFMNDGRTFSAEVSVVFVGSSAGRFGEAFHADYAASKAALQGLQLSLKNELPEIAPRGRVNTIAPGWTATPMAKEAMAKEGVIEKALATTPMMKIAEPKDVARQILVISSEEIRSCHRRDDHGPRRYGRTPPQFPRVSTRRHRTVTGDRRCTQS